MAKIKELRHIHEGKEWHHRQFVYWCPGCGYEHAFSIKADGGLHDFNMDLNNPTISPSLLLDNPQHYRVCHSFIEGGKIRFLNDCWHELKGQTVELPDIEQMLEERIKKTKWRSN